LKREGIFTFVDAIMTEKNVRMMTIQRIKNIMLILQTFGYAFCEPGKTCDFGRDDDLCGLTVCGGLEGFVILNGVKRSLEECKYL